MNRVTFSRVLAVLTTAYAVLVIVTGTAITPGYSHIRNYISELGASGAAYGELVSWIGFLPVGVLLAIFLVVALPVVRAQAVSASCSLLVRNPWRISALHSHPATSAARRQVAPRRICTICSAC